MYYCDYYRLIHPLRSPVVDDSTKTPAFEVPLQTKDHGLVEIALFCDQRGFPEFARCTIHNLESHVIPETALNSAHTFTEHLLTVLHFTYSEDVEFARYAPPVWTFHEEGSPHSLNMKIEETLDPGFDVEGARNIYRHTINIRDHLRLYMDGIDRRIPLQYQFLSLYKLLELYCKKGGKWNDTLFDQLIAAHAQELGAVCKIEPKACLHSLRDKCAHIKTGSTKRDSFGVTHLNTREARRVSEVLPTLRAMCADVINALGGGNFMIRPPDTPQGA